MHPSRVFFFLKKMMCGLGMLCLDVSGVGFENCTWHKNLDSSIWFLFAYLESYDTGHIC